MRVLLAVLVLAAAGTAGAEEAPARFSGGRMKAAPRAPAGSGERGSAQPRVRLASPFAFSGRGAFGRGGSDSGTAFSRRWKGARGRGSRSSGPGLNLFHRSAFSPTTEKEPSPQDYGLSAPVAGAKVQPIGFKTEPGGPTGTLGVEGGRIEGEESKAIAIKDGFGPFEMPKDKLPPPNPGSGGRSGGGASGRTGITPNSPLPSGGP